MEPCKAVRVPDGVYRCFYPLPADRGDGGFNRKAHVMLNHFLDGFFKVFGYICAALLVFYFYRLCNRKKAPRWAWEAYIDMLIKEENYTEVMRLMALIETKDRHALIRTPKGYSVRLKRNLDLKDRFDEMTWVISHSYIIKQKANKADKGHEIKEKD